MSKFDELVQRVIKWSEGIDLYNQSTVLKQASKAYEEFAELLSAMDDGDTEEIKDAIGDIVVCLVNASHLSSETLIAQLGREESDDPKLDEVVLCVSSDIIEDPISAVSNLSIIANAYGATIDECFEMAVETIEKRKLLMVNGKAVKWENMTDEQRELWVSRNEV